MDPSYLRFMVRMLQNIIIAQRAAIGALRAELNELRKKHGV